MKKYAVYIVLYLLGIDQYGFEKIYMYNMTCMLFFRYNRTTKLFFLLFYFRFTDHVITHYVNIYLKIFSNIILGLGYKKKKLKRWNVCHSEQSKILVFKRVTN